MTVKDKVQRAAAAAVLSRLIKYVRKDPDTNLVKLVDRSERFVGNIFPAKNFDSFREGAKDPENVWRQLALRLIDEIDDNVLMNMMLALGLGAGVNGTKTVRANRENITAIFRGSFSSTRQARATASARAAGVRNTATSRASLLMSSTVLSTRASQWAPISICSPAASRF